MTTEGHMWYACLCLRACKPISEDGPVIKLVAAMDRRYDVCPPASGLDFAQVRSVTAHDAHTTPSEAEIHSVYGQSSMFLVNHPIVKKQQAHLYRSL